MASGDQRDAPDATGSGDEDEDEIGEEGDDEVEETNDEMEEEDEDEYISDDDEESEDNQNKLVAFALRKQLNQKQRQKCELFYDIRCTA